MSGVPMIATPIYAKDVAVKLAAVHGETFDLLPRDRRDWWWELAAWVTEHIKDDEFHEGCFPREVAADAQEEAFKDGYAAAFDEVKDMLQQAGQDAQPGGPERETLRKVWRAVRPTESAQALEAKVAAYMAANAVRE